jgi:hypothetical protein
MIVARRFSLSKAKEDVVLLEVEGDAAFTDDAGVDVLAWKGKGGYQLVTSRRNRVAAGKDEPFLEWEEKPSSG